MSNEKSWSDWWWRFLGFSPDGSREVVKILQDCYVEEMQYVKRYTQHAERMQYPQFRERLLAIAADEARHAEWLAQQITRFGADLPAVPEVTAAEKNSWQYLVGDLEEERQRAAQLVGQMRRVRGEFPDIAEILDRIYEDGKKHRAEISAMLMRSDPQSIWPA